MKQNKERTVIVTYLKSEDDFLTNIAEYIAKQLYEKDIEEAKSQWQRRLTLK